MPLRVGLPRRAFGNLDARPVRADPFPVRPTFLRAPQLHPSRKVDSPEEVPQAGQKRETSGLNVQDYIDSLAATVKKTNNSPSPRRRSVFLSMPSVRS